MGWEKEGDQEGFVKDGKQGELRKRKVTGAASYFAKFMPHLLVKELNPTVFRPKNT